MKAYYASPGEKSDYIGKQDYTEIQVTLPIYAVACVSLVGWVFFAMFAGVGLVALPIDLMHTFTDRPTSIDVKNWAAKRNELKERAAKLRAIGEKMEKENFTSVKLTRNDQKLFNKFKNAVYLLEKDYEILRVRKFEKGGNILYYIGMGILGVIGVFVSLLWVIHTVLFVFMHNAHPFLNTLLVGLDNVFPLFGTVGFGTFAFYLLWWCVSFLLIRHSAHMPAQPHACLHTSVLACSSPGASSVSVCLSQHNQGSDEDGDSLCVLHDSPDGAGEDDDELIPLQRRDHLALRDTCDSVLQ